MRTTLLLSFLLLCASWLAAQVYPAQTLAPDRGTKTGNNQMTYEGCLSQSGGNYTLTDRAGIVYQLVGVSDELAGKAGHTVEITAVNPSHVPDSVAVASASNSGTLPLFLTVTSFQHVSSSCSSK